MLARKARGWGAAWQPRIKPDATRHHRVTEAQLQAIYAQGQLKSLNVDSLCLERNRCLPRELTKGAAEFFLSHLKSMPRRVTEDSSGRRKRNANGGPMSFAIATLLATTDADRRIQPGRGARPCRLREIIARPASGIQEEFSNGAIMKNRSAAFTQNTLLYTKAYRRIAGSVTATILFQRLEYRFSKYPKGFYKFLEPSPNNRAYRVGDSWTEELEFSVDEFRSAFDAIGIRYKSQTEFKAAAHPFMRKPGKEKSRKKKSSEQKEALYCSVLDKSTGLTMHYRNHALVDRLLDELISGREAVEESKPALIDQLETGGADGNSNLPSGYSHLADGDRQMAGWNFHLPSVDPHFMNHVPHTSEHDSSMAHADGTHSARASVSEDNPPGEKSSRHDFATILQWARSQIGVTSALALATARFKDGLADGEIDRWLARIVQAARPSGRVGDFTVAPMPGMPGIPDPDLLARFLAAVQARVNAKSFLEWFKPISDLARDGALIYLAVPNAVFRDWITNNYVDVIEDVRTELGLEDCQIEFLEAGAAHLQLST